MSSDRSDITRLLEEARDGDRLAVDDLLPVVYEELRKLAQGQLQHERSNHTLQATALAHEAYLKLVDQRRATWESRAHFLAVASIVIRRILVDHARHRNADKRGAGQAPLTLNTAHALPDHPEFDVLIIHEALDRLAQAHPDRARIVELRFFGGLSNAEIAQVVNTTIRTVERRWQFAKAWLYREVFGDG